MNVPEQGYISMMVFSWTHRRVAYSAKAAQIQEENQNRSYSLQCANEQAAERMVMFKVMGGAIHVRENDAKNSANDQEYKIH